ERADLGLRSQIASKRRRVPRTASAGATGIGQDVTERNRAAADLRLLAREQAALRRVATCVASEADPSSVFDIVAEEVGRLLGGRAANVVRFEPDADAGTLVGGWTGDFRSFEVGSQV